MTVPVVQTGKRPALRLASRRVVLEPLGRRHLGDLYELATKDGMADRWMLRGRRMTPAEFEDFVWQIGRLQYAILRRDRHELIGVVHGLDDDARSRTIGIGLAVDPGLWRTGWPFEAVVLFLDLLFEVKGFRKVYVKLPESTLRRVGRALETWLTTEAVLERHARGPDGDFEDWHVLALHRRQWDRGIVDLVARPAERRAAAGTTGGRP